MTCIAATDSSRLDAAFVAFLREATPLCMTSFSPRARCRTPSPARTSPNSSSRLRRISKTSSASCSAYDAELRALKARHDTLAPLYSVKRLFVQRRAMKKYDRQVAQSFDGDALRGEVEALIGGELTELRFAEWVAARLDTKSEHADALDVAARYAAWATHTPEGQQRHKAGVLFKAPGKVDPMRLVPVETEVVDGVTMLKLPEHHRRRREGFALTDPGMDLTGALDQANYCIWCHNQGKDSCAKGLTEKSGAFKRNEFGVALAGCPLEEKISEMNLVKARGETIGALAIAVIDNPMCAATGHRICNDCMKSCIYQKQDPVDIPQIETRTLKDVLALPWGFEIYSLLTRWNPLNIRRPLPKPASGHTVLVVGLGPAGFTLAHHLMNDGHAVVAIDGLKIEPLPADISGVDPRRRARAFRPIRDISVRSRRPWLAGDGRLRRRRRIRHHRALEQEFSQAHAFAAGAPRRVRDVRRRALRRHARHRGALSRWASITSRSAPARESRPWCR